MNKNFTPRMVLIKVSELKVDRTYQRTESIKKALVNVIVKNFNPHLLGVLIVSQRDNAYYVVDGQHRLEALKRLGIETAWCSVENGLTQEAEAKEFIEYNSKRNNLSQASIHKGKVAAGDSVAIKITEVLARYYFALDGRTRYQFQKGGNTINAIKVVYDQFSRLSETDFERLMALLRITWNGDSVSLDGRVISGLGLVIRKCGLFFNNKDFAAKMHTKDPGEILRIGKAYKGSHADSGKSYALAILQMYNAGRTTKRIPESLIYE